MLQRRLATLGLSTFLLLLLLVLLLLAFFLALLLAFLLLLLAFLLALLLAVLLGSACEPLLHLLKRLGEHTLVAVHQTHEALPVAWHTFSRFRRWHLQQRRAQPRRRPLKPWKGAVSLLRLLLQSLLVVALDFWGACPAAKISKRQRQSLLYAARRRRRRVGSARRGCSHWSHRRRRCNGCVWRARFGNERLGNRCRGTPGAQQQREIPVCRVGASECRQTGLLRSMLGGGLLGVSCGPRGEAEEQRAEGHRGGVIVWPCHQQACSLAVLTQTQEHRA